MKPTTNFTPALNNIIGTKIPIGKNKKPMSQALEKKAKPAIKQYGDKGYKPSDGTGVGM